MHISLDTRVTGAIAELIMTHRSTTLVWQARHASVKESHIFSEINDYWAQLPLPTQDAIFAVYTRIHEFFENCYEQTQKKLDVGVLMQQLRPFVAELFDLHPQADLDYWVRVKSNLIIPVSVPKAFDPDAGHAGTRERTYLEEDYRELLPLAISMRIMIPVWGAFSVMVKDEIPATFMGQMCFRLLSASNVIDCSAMRRLRVFVEHTIPKEANSTAIVMAGVSSEDFPEWVLGRTVVEKLSKAPLIGTNPNGNLISYLFIFVSQSSTNIENMFGRISSKHAETSSNDEQNLSRIEGFKIKQDVSQGDIAAISHYLKKAIQQATGQIPMNPLSLIKRLNPDPAFVEAVVLSINSINALKSEQLVTPQVNLAGWVLSSYISPRAIPHLKKEDILRMMALSQAYLWYHGHRELAGIVSGIGRLQGMDESGFLSDSKLRMDRTLVDQFTHRFAYPHRTASRARNAKSINPAVKTVDLMVNMLSEYIWFLTLPEPWVQQLQGGTKDRRFATPINIRNLLSQLTVELDEKYRHPVELGV